MDREELLERYRAYIDCLNRRAWSRLGDIVSDKVRYNGETIGLSGYLKMLERDVAAIPDLAFHIDFLIANPPVVGARLLFDCTPLGELFGLAVNGRRIAFTENVEGAGVTDFGARQPPSAEFSLVNGRAWRQSQLNKLGIGWMSVR